MIQKYFGQDISLSSLILFYLTCQERELCTVTSKKSQHVKNEIFKKFKY